MSIYASGFFAFFFAKFGDWPLVNRFLLGSVLMLICVNTGETANAVSEADRSVVRVVVATNAGWMVGTGFVVGNGDIVATNDHVIRNAKSIFVLSKEFDGEPRALEAEIEAGAPNSDLALLRVRGLSLPPLPLVVGSPLKGSGVIAIGFPAVADLAMAINAKDRSFVESTITQGVIGRFLRGAIGNSKSRTELVQHSAAVNGGNSGGPLIDMCGNVLGVNTSKAFGELVEDGLKVDSTEGIYFASHASALARLLKAEGIEHRLAVSPCSSQSPQSPVVGAQPSDGLKWSWIALGSVSVLSIAVVTTILAMRNSRQGNILGTLRRANAKDGHELSLEDKRGHNWELRGFGADGREHCLVLDEAVLGIEGITIGRDPSLSTLIVDDPSVSRRHVKLSVREHRIYISDLDSSNGTRIDGVNVAATPIGLKSGQIILIGKVQMTLRRART